MVFACIFLPLFASLLVALFGKALGRRGSQGVTCGCIVLSAVISCWILAVTINNGMVHSVQLFEWIQSGSFSANWGIYVDSLSALMIFVVTSVSALVHIYSIGYMNNDPHVPRFMCYLSLFTFSMLILVTSNNFVQLFFGWEGVGLCSYLLIGFWNTKSSANTAALKAFVVNRVGDLGLILGIAAIFMVFGTVDFRNVFNLAPEVSGQKISISGFSCDAITVICLLLFFGAMGKSAQIGLHTWLADAMEGPTPVSALIHAATMVTAGVFLVARCSPLFELSEIALLVVTLVGGVTAFMAASIALVQVDIKRVVAYSTCSQLGYMFFACGLSAYSAAIFHLFTHAFFKALLFLGAGSVIHALSGEQDMRKMGGVWRLIPGTYGVRLIGAWALIGLPPFSGYFSKDLILETAYSSHTLAGTLVFWLGMAVVAMTAFYTAKVMLMSFHGKFGEDEKVLARIHESPKTMMIPLFLLAIGAVGAGYFGLSMVEENNLFWRNALYVSDHHAVIKFVHHSPPWVKLLPLIVSLGGLVGCWLMFSKYRGRLVPYLGRLTFVRQLLVEKWFFDYLYDVALTKFVKRVGYGFWKAIDESVIDALGPQGVADVVLRTSQRLSQGQTGYIYHYAFVMIIGVACLLTFYALWGAAI